MIGLVGCGKSKRPTASPARDLYTGNLFRLALAYALARCDVVYVVSALHGLLPLDRVIEPYDSSFTRAQSSAPRCLEWSLGVWRDLAVRHDLRSELQSVLVLVGANYAGPLLAGAVDLSLNVELLEPLRGMQIGQRLSFLAGTPRGPRRFSIERDDSGAPVAMHGEA